MDQSLESQIQTYLAHLDGLIRRGQELRDALTGDPSEAATVAAMRRWQEDCGVTINQLSGGSKAHWLARAFSQAFLMRTADGRAVEGAAPAELAQQLLGYRLAGDAGGVRHRVPEIAQRATGAHREALMQASR